MKEKWMEEKWEIKDIPQVIKNHCEDLMDERNILMLQKNIEACIHGTLFKKEHG